MTRLPDPRPVWKAIVAAGGLMPVSDAERARFLRVQAAHRAVYGLPENTPEERLIDARKGDPRSIRQLAGLYLRDYAQRLNPDDPALEPVDRAALAWRDTTEADTEPELIVEYEQPELIPGRWAALLAGHITPADL